MLIDFKYLFDASLGLPRGALLFGPVPRIKPLPCVVATETFQLLNTADLSIDLLRRFLENDKREDWKLLKETVDPLSSWTYRALVLSLVKEETIDKNKKSWLDGFFLDRQLTKILKSYEKEDLFAGLAKLNGVLLYLDSKFGKSKGKEEESYALREIKLQLDLFDSMKLLGIDIQPGDYMNKLSYLQFECFNKLGAIKKLNRFAENAPMGLTEEGRQDLLRDIENLQKFNCERNYVYSRETPIWHGYFSAEALEDPFTPDRQKYLERRCGSDSIIYRQYLKDKDEFSRAV